jgi:hypothetical protein
VNAVSKNKAAKNIFLRMVSVMTLTAFVMTSFHSDFAHAAVPGLRETESVSHEVSNPKLPTNLASITVPGEIGKIEDLYAGDSGQTVILIQDAHAIPDAQRNIHKLINFFRSQYGIDTIAAEGSASEMDPQIFKSFPDQELLKKVFEKYLEAGELNGTAAAAIFSSNDKSSLARKEARFTGIEDWNLYEAGVEAYLRAMEQEPASSKKLKIKSEQLKKEKERIYSSQLLEIDRLLESFRTNGAALSDVLLKLSEVKAPEPVSDLAMILEEQKNNAELGAEGVEKAAQELNRVVRAVQQQLEFKGEDGKSQLALLNTQYQDYLTSRMSPEALSLFLKELISEEHLSVLMSDSLGQKAARQKRMRDLEGTKFFLEFEGYVRSVKGSLFRNDAERKLDRQTRCLELLERLAKLELNRRDWAKIHSIEKVQRNDLERRTKVSTKVPLDDGPWTDFKQPIAFYENALKREAALFENLLKLSNPSKFPLLSSTSVPTIFVAGGFHSQGMTRLFKERGISYLLVRPQINSLPGNNRYRGQMK